MQLPRRSRSSAWFVLAITLSLPASARAEPPISARRSLEIIVPEALAVGFGAGVAAAPGPTGAKWAVLGTCLGAGAASSVFVHWAHGQPEKGFVGIGLRIGTTFGGFIAAMNLACTENCDDRRALTVGTAGLAVGSMLGAVFDGLWLANDLPLGKPASTKGQTRVGLTFSGTGLGFVGVW